MQNSEERGLVWRHKHNGEDITVNLQEISNKVSDWFQFIIIETGEEFLQKQ
jgi:hypothetical protein